MPCPTRVWTIPCPTWDELAMPCHRRLNMELDLQSLFGLLCIAVFIGWDPATPHPPHWTHIRGRYWLAKIDDISLSAGYEPNMTCPNLVWTGNNAMCHIMPYLGKNNKPYHALLRYELATTPCPTWVFFNHDMPYLAINWQPCHVPCQALPGYELASIPCTMSSPSWVWTSNHTMPYLGMN